jgi:hypothetical protein
MNDTEGHALPCMYVYTYVLLFIFFMLGRVLERFAGHLSEKSFVKVRWWTLNVVT